MRLLRTRAELAQWRAEQRAAGIDVAFVATMGNLHEGHLRLIEQAGKLAKPTVVLASIFVNPLQFNDPGDLARYPRTEDDDCAQLAAQGVDAVFMPDVATMYPDSSDGETGLQVRVWPGVLAERWEGAVRPGHFAGMATIVAKFFNLVRPEFALFGEKDFQQLQIVRRMVRDLDFDITILSVPTVRSADGLALSSRNRFLTPSERSVAPRLSVELQRAAARIRQGDQPLDQVLADGRDALEAVGFGIDYFVYCDVEQLLPRQDHGPGILLAAVRLGAVRLLDNCRVSG